MARIKPRRMTLHDPRHERQDTEQTMDLGLKDRVAIVTGGNRGIGYAISADC